MFYFCRIGCNSPMLMLLSTVLLLIALNTEGKAQTPAEQACFDAVQNKVAWSNDGQTAWDDNNVREFCGGVGDIAVRISCFKNGIAAHNDWQKAINECRTVGTAAVTNDDTPVAIANQTNLPASAEQACFDAVQNKVAWSNDGQTAWDDNNVREFCSGVGDIAVRISCFKNGIAAHNDWQKAINECRTVGTAAVTNDDTPVAIANQTNLPVSVVSMNDGRQLVMNVVQPGETWRTSLIVGTVVQLQSNGVPLSTHTVQPKPEGQLLVASANNAQSQPSPATAGAPKFSVDGNAARMVSLGWLSFVQSGPKSWVEVERDSDVARRTLLEVYRDANEIRLFDEATRIYQRFVLGTGEAFYAKENEAWKRVVYPIAEVTAEAKAPGSNQVWYDAGTAPNNGTAQSVSGQTVSMMDFGTTALVEVMPDQFALIDKRSWTKFGTYVVQSRSQTEIHLFDYESRYQIKVDFQTGQVLSGLEGQALSASGFLQTSSDDSRIPGSAIDWKQQPAAQPQPQPQRTPETVTVEVVNQTGTQVEFWYPYGSQGKIKSELPVGAAKSVVVKEGDEIQLFALGMGDSGAVLARYVATREKRQTFFYNTLSISEKTAKVTAIFIDGSERTVQVKPSIWHHFQGNVLVGKYIEKRRDLDNGIIYLSLEGASSGGFVQFDIANNRVLCCWSDDISSQNSTANIESMSFVNWYEKSHTIEFVYHKLSQISGSKSSSILPKFEGFMSGYGSDWEIDRGDHPSGITLTPSGRIAVTMARTGKSGLCGVLAVSRNPIGAAFKGESLDWEYNCVLGNHPNSIQATGEIIAVSHRSPGRIDFYKISERDSPFKHLSHLSVHKGSESIGITYSEFDDRFYLLLGPGAVTSDQKGKVEIWQSTPGLSLEDLNNKFTLNSSIEGVHESGQGTSLIMGTDQRLYVAAHYSSHEDFDYAAVVWNCGTNQTSTTDVIGISVLKQKADSREWGLEESFLPADVGVTQQRCILDRPSWRFGGGAVAMNDGSIVALWVNRFNRILDPLSDDDMNIALQQVR